MKWLILKIAIVAALAACAATAVPDVAYFRMPTYALAEPASGVETKWTLPILVEPLRANGVYNDQSILYALKPEGSIKAYHYQLWDDAPGVMLQRRLIDMLRARHASKLATDRLPAVIDAIRISGTIERFERIQTPSGWMARVRMELRVERDAQAAPLLLSEYGADVPADSDTIESSVRAFARAIDVSLDAFWSELATVPMQ